MKHTRTVRALVLSVLASASLAGCPEQPLENRTKVIKPRVLAVIAEPPEVRPGGTVNFHMILGGFGNAVPSGLRWLICARPEATTGFIAQSSFGEAMPDVGCFGTNAEDVFEIGNDVRSDFTFPENTLSRLEALRAIYGDLLSDETLRNIAQRAGIAVTVSVEMTDPTNPGQPLQALKRVVVVDKTDTNVNPPPPHFRFGVDSDAGANSGAEFRGSSADPEHCESASGRVLQVTADTAYEIAPVPDESTCLQSYEQLDAMGNISPRQETAFYSWFSTDGEFSLAKTRIPTRNNRWRAPSTPGRVTHWIIVRDGRGGASACHYELDVIAP